MAPVSIRNLQTNAAGVIDGLSTHGPAIITRNGQPVAVLSPIPTEALDDLVARTSPHILQVMDAAERSVREKTPGVSHQAVRRAIGLD